MSSRVTTRLRGPGASWLRAHGLEVALALPLVAYLLVLTAAPIVETVRLSFSAPLDGGFPSLGWNEFLYARLLTTSQNTLPLQVFQAIDRGTRQQMAAVAVVLVLPILGVVAVLQRYLRPGAMAGAIRG